MSRRNATPVMDEIITKHPHFPSFSDEERDPERAIAVYDDITRTRYPNIFAGQDTYQLLASGEKVTAQRRSNDGTTGSRRSALYGDPLPLGDLKRPYEFDMIDHTNKSYVIVYDGKEEYMLNTTLLPDGRSEAVLNIPKTPLEDRPLGQRRRIAKRIWQEAKREKRLF